MKHEVTTFYIIAQEIINNADKRVRVSQAIKEVVRRGASQEYAVDATKAFLEHGYLQLEVAPVKKKYVKLTKQGCDFIRSVNAKRKEAQHA